MTLAILVAFQLIYAADNLWFEVSKIEKKQDVLVIFSSRIKVISKEAVFNNTV